MTRLIPVVLAAAVLPSLLQAQPTHRGILERYNVKSNSFCGSQNRVDTPEAQQPTGVHSHVRNCTGASTNATLTVTAPPVINGRFQGNGYLFEDPILVNATIRAVLAYPKARGTFVTVAVPIADSVEFAFTPRGSCTQNVVTNTPFEGMATLTATNNCVRNAFQSTMIFEGGVTKLMVSTNANASPFPDTGQTASPPQVSLEVVAIYRIEAINADLALDHIEVVQVVQDKDNTVPLIQGKPTVVRVFPKLAKPVAGGPTSQTGVTAELRGFFRGVELPLSPILPFNGPISAVAAPQRENAAHSLNFKIPHIWTTNSAISFTTEVKGPGTTPDPTPADNTGNLSVSLQPSPSLNIAWLPLCIDDGLSIDCPDLARLARFDVLIEKMFPISPLNFTYAPLPVAQRTYGGNQDASAIISYLRRFYDLFAGGVDQLATWLPRDNGRSVYGISDPLWSSSDPGQGRVSWQQDTTDLDPLDPAFTLAHEVGHNLGRRHTHRADGCKARDPATDWPVDFATSNIREVGFDPILRIVKLPSLLDVMTYCSPPASNIWMSPFTYQQLIAAGLKPASEPARRLVDVEHIVIGGVAKRDGSGGSILPGYRVQAAASATPPPASPTHCLRFFGEGGAVLGEQCFVLTFRDHRDEDVIYDEESFSVKAPFFAGTRRIGLFAGSTELASLRPGAGAPQVAIVTPQSGDVWNGGSRTITWSASDPDGDALTYSVLYSSDAGATWIPMEVDTQSTQYAFSPDDIEGGRTVRFRVLATDGINTGTAEVGPIDVVQIPRIAVTPDRVDGRKLVLRQVRDQSVTVTNSGTGPLRIAAITSSLENEYEILTRTPLVIPAGQSREIVVRFSPLQVGVREGRLAIASNDPARPSLEVLLTGRGIATVESDMDLPERIDFGNVAAGTTKDFALAVRNFGGLFLTLNTLTLNNAAFGIVSPAIPIGVEAGAVRIVTLRFTAGAAGTQTGQLTITSTDPTRAQVVLPVTATVVAGVVPVASAAGVVSAASFLGGPVAAGEIITIFGDTIGPPAIAGLRLNAEGRVDTTAGETRVLFDGVPAPIIYALAGQTSVIVPYAVEGRATTQMVVEYQGRRSDPVTLPVAASAPALFSANSSGRGPGAILNQDTSVNTPENPAEKGSVVVLFGTGEGRTDPEGVDGQLATTVFPKPRVPVRVSIGGIDAEVLYFGAAPGLVAGVLQVNVKIPEGVGSGNVPVVVTVGSASSQAELTVAVR